MRAVAHQVAKLIVAAVHHPLPYHAPLADHNPLVGMVGTAVAEGVALNDVLAEQETDTLHTFGLTRIGKQRFVLLHKIVQQPMSASLGIVGKEFDAVDAAHRQYGILLILQLGVLLGGHPLAANLQFAPQNLYQEIAIATSRLQKTGVEPLGLRLHQVEHGIHLARIGEDLAMVGHALFRFDLSATVMGGR